MSTQRPKYICNECGVPYGPLGSSKPKTSYCTYCWDVYLRQQQLNIAIAQRAWNAAKVRPSS